MKKFETPLHNLKDYYGDDQCKYCSYINKTKTWYCSGYRELEGINPCLKVDSFSCPVAHKENERG